jgi:hypothetical protein
MVKHVTIQEADSNKFNEYCDREMSAGGGCFVVLSRVRSSAECKILPGSALPPILCCKGMSGFSLSSRRP